MPFQIWNSQLGAGSAHCELLGEGKREGRKERRMEVTLIKSRDPPGKGGKNISANRPLPPIDQANLIPVCHQFFVFRYVFLIMGLVLQTPKPFPIQGSRVPALRFRCCFRVRRGEKTRHFQDPAFERNTHHSEFRGLFQIHDVDLSRDGKAVITIRFHFGSLAVFVHVFEFWCADLLHTQLDH